MRSERDKGDAEIKIFTEFISAAGLPFDPNTIQKRLPPEPDLICVHASEGQTAFELVEICDPKIAQIVSNANRSDVGGVVTFHTSDPSGTILRKKLRKKYETAHPIELLCYTDGRVITPDDVIIPTVQPMLRSFRSVFRRAWLFGRSGAHLIWDAS